MSVICQYFHQRQNHLPKIAKRAHLQACTWMHALNEDPPVLLPKSYGWLRYEATQTLSPLTVPHGDEPAPEDLLKLIK